MDTVRAFARLATSAGFAPFTIVFFTGYVFHGGTRGRVVVRSFANGYALSPPALPALPTCRWLAALLLRPRRAFLLRRSSIVPLGKIVS